MADTSDTRTPAQIEADIKRRREVLAETLDEIGVRVHPKTIVGDAKAKVVANVDQTVGRAYVRTGRPGWSGWCRWRCSPWGSWGCSLWASGAARADPARYGRVEGR